jgi:hypothetical protein
VDARPEPVVSGAELGDRLKPMANPVKTEDINIETPYRLERRSVMDDVVIDAEYTRQTVERHSRSG